MQTVPLNKVHPAILLWGQLRPIMFINHLVVQITQCIQILRKYVQQKINASQICFIYSLHIASLVRGLQSQLRIRQKARTTIFLDISNVYNTVRREKVFKLLREEKKFGDFLNQQKLHGLKWIYDQLQIDYQVEQRKFYFQIEFTMDPYLCLSFLMYILANQLKSYKGELDQQCFQESQEKKNVGKKIQHLNNLDEQKCLGILMIWQY
ncbi:unnamed protein product [Paramecium pentaurelia]|uniref:Reverse transcriptase domain-containing protein n=1 Tax=Paramecium pentaurelia TaxID=43138 RepID=A0A8S1YK78_9CILI|nr:unnamed protein product [Paramecium pentaurelia]